jgi:hypothetical protein
VRNDFGDVEKKLGLYGNGMLNWSSTKVVRDKDVVKRLTSHTTGVRLAVNSQSNGSNPASLTLSHSLVRQSRGLNLSVTGGLFLAGSRERGENSGRSISFLRGQVRLPMGLEVNLSMEKGESSLNGLEVSQTVGKGWAVGIYGRNYATVVGPQTREAGKRSMGFVVTHSPKKSMGFRGGVGIEDGRLQVQVQGEVGF